MRCVKTIAIICAVMLQCMAAHAANKSIGLCRGTIATDGFGKVGTATISAAATIPGELLAPYKGAKVVAVRAGLVASAPLATTTNLVGWVSTDHSSAEHLAESSPQTPFGGWNTLTLNGTPIEVDGTALTVGYTFSQTKNERIISAVGGVHANGFWFCKNGVWTDMSRELGTLSIELVLSHPDLPEHDLVLVKVGGVPAVFKPGEGAKLALTVRNETFDPVDGFDYDCVIAPDTHISGHSTLHLECNQEGIELIDISSCTDTMKAGTNYDVTATIIPSATDDDKTNNTATCLLGCYETTLPRRVLIEEFTTEKCGNCPRAIATLKECYNKGYGDKISVVAHHVGYYTDWLTVDEDKQYLEFYSLDGSAGTYAPAVMLDRTIVSGSSPVRTIGVFSQFEPQLKAALEVPAFVTLSGALDIDAATRSLTATFDVEKIATFDALCPEPRITAYIVEDKILHHEQAGISSSDFTHSHVYRKALSDIWGDNVAFDQDKAKATFTATIPGDWNMANLSVVAFVHSYESQTLTGREVHNSIVLHSPITANLDELTTPQQVLDRTKPVYNVLGQRVSTDHKGIAIQNGHKFIIR